MIKPAYPISFLLSNIFVWQNVLYFPNAFRSLFFKTPTGTLKDFFKICWKTWARDFKTFRQLCLRPYGTGNISCLTSHYLLGNNVCLTCYWETNEGLTNNLLKPNDIYRVSQEERTKLREGVPYVKLYRYNPKHLCPKLNGY